MKIVFTGGGTGGHFYPLIAIAEAVHDQVKERQLVAPALYYFADLPYDEEALYKQGMTFVKIPAGKIRRYFSFQNITGIFATLSGFFTAFFTLLKLYPDVVISKGSYASVPTVLAAGLLRIPLIIHESDAKPGRATLLGAKYATRIAITYDSVSEYLPAKTRGKVARTGIPVRKELLEPLAGGKELLGLEATAPTIVILGGSLGSRRINETVLDALPELVSFANVIHQTGKAHFDQVQSTAKVILEGNTHKNRYHAFPFLNIDSIRQAASAADVVISRSGSTSITEISLWKKPAILIPIPEAVSHDQRSNAYAYAKTGAAVVLEEGNLTPHVLASEARRISTDPTVRATMASHAEGFANPNAARIIAEEAIRIALTHEPSVAST